MKISLQTTRQKTLKVATFSILAYLAMIPLSANAKEVVIDVRTPEEYQVSHPAGAINVPYTSIVSAIASKGVSKQDTIKLYSRSGNRADLAKAALQTAGYTNTQVQQ